MTVGQTRAWERLWPSLGQDIASLPAGPVDLPGWFGRVAPVTLEIGSGMGETTAALAEAEPEVNYLAVDVYQPGLAQLMMRAETAGLKNLRLMRGDAVVLLEQHLPPESLTTVRIYYPDPWPKKKHHKRRLVQPSLVSVVASRLVPGGTLHLATDWEHYAEHMLAVGSAEPLLRNRFADEPGGWAPRPPWRPLTKFESRAEEEGRVSRDLIFERR
ncbi:tRNA (guanosine(46)-N7)-methyltransferase TrmB [Actinophytocola sp.]|uniref:tRNA (guanosine(46)-N7)-methyltransferase TrmB n=1 Tax=Actinophytocola sp. TaxID=1872138 RepID=UPI002ED037A5